MSAFNIKALSETSWPAFAALVERHGFERVRRLGKNHWVVSKQVEKNCRPGADQ